MDFFLAFWSSFLFYRSFSRLYNFDSVFTKFYRKRSAFMKNICCSCAKYRYNRSMGEYRLRVGTLNISTATWHDLTYLPFTVLFDFVHSKGSFINFCRSILQNIHNPLNEHILTLMWYLKIFKSSTFFGITTLWFNLIFLMVLTSFKPMKPFPL